MKVLIGAVGLGKYTGTTYSFEDGSQQAADYFLYALTQHVKPDRLIVIATEAAKQTALPELEEWIALENVPITVVDIPNGKDRNEAWTIFNAIVAKYDELYPVSAAQPEVYIDVTNGFRSIPILMLSVARYLQRSRRMDLRGIYYGAFDASRDELLKPVYQVDSFITVLDWATAVDTFLTTGNSLQLAEMLDTQTLYIDRADRIANALRDLSEALDLVRIEEVHQQAHELVQAIASANIQDMTDEYRIIRELLYRLESEFQPLAMCDTRANLTEFLRKNLKLILWYFKRNRYQDSMLVAREWMLTYKMQHKNAKNNRTYSAAEIFERENRDSEQGDYKWNSQDKKKLHREINEVRNSLAHGGFADGETSASMVARINSVIANLQKLETVL